MREVKRLDQVFMFGDKLSFLIPHEWVEGESEDDGTYLYHYPDADSGRLRVSLVTLKTVGDDPAERLQTLFQKKENHWRDEETGNLVHMYEKDSEQNGVLLHIYYWLVGNFVPPDLVHEAVFSYTILRDQINSEENQAMLNVLSQVLPRADFYRVVD
jgi:hypothetical protein